MFRPLRFETLEDRRLLAVVTVSNLTDDVNGDTASIAALLADDGGDGISLREALAAANADSDVDTINFSVTGTITLELGELHIAENLTIQGPSANRLTIDADGASRVFLVDDGDTGTLIDVTISGLTITGGVAEAGFGDGGGILNRETLTVIACDIMGNSADDGGGIGNFIGTFLLVDSTVRGNMASGALGGGAGIFNFSNTVADASTISNSTISDNVMTNAETTGGGGGVYNFLGTLIVEFSTIANNDAPADLGSGIASLGDTNYAVTIVHSSIVAGNVHSDVDHVVGLATSFQSLGYNVIGFGNSTGPFTASGDQRFVVDPLLGSLTDNGGPTPTHAVLAGSPAMDKGDPNVVPGESGAPLFDQRGFSFGRVADGDDDGTPQMDAGAFESHALAYVVDTLDDESDDDYSLGHFSLREAIELANLDPGADEIRFSPALFSGGPTPMSLVLGELPVSDSAIIVGPGAEWLTIDAGQNSRIFNVDDLDDQSLMEVAISGLTLTGGLDTSGGAIYSQELLTLSDTVITGDTAQWGGGLYNAYYAK